MAYDEKDDTQDSPEDRAEHVRKNWREAKDALQEWRNMARKCYLFRDGDQWDAADSAQMKTDQRPALTFNRIGAMVDAICGVEINNRQEVHYYPRTMEDVRINEIYTEAAKWARDNCYAEHEESDAFRDAATCGIGVTETLMDYEQNIDGDIKKERRDPLKCAWSPYAQKECLEDAREVYYWDYIKKSEVEAKWGVDVIYSDEPSDSSIQHQVDRVLVYDEESWPDDKQKGQVLVLHYQCYKLEPVYRAADPFTQKEVKYGEKEFNAIKEKVKKLGMEFSENPQGPNEIRYVKQMQRVYYRGFYCGNQELEWGKLPIQDGRGFTFRFITCKRDHVKKMWYRPVLAMIDPQQWGNKFLSLTVDIMSRNAKGGVFVEEMALQDPKKAEEQWATPAPFIVLNEGGLAKLKERQQAQYPAGWDRLMNFSFESLHWVSGLNAEVLGMQGNVQAGVLEETRKKAAIAILAPLFDALKRYRASDGYLMLAFIRKFLMDGRLVRITGKKGDVQYMQLLANEDTAEYDVVVDDAPNSPDFRERVWAGLQPLIPALIKEGVKLPASVIKYAPGITEEVAMELQKAMDGVPDPRVQAQMQQMQKQLQQVGEQAQKLAEENQMLKVDRQVEVMELNNKHSQQVQNLQGKLVQNQNDNQTERGIAQLQETTKKLLAAMENDRKEREMMLESMTKIKVATIAADATKGRANNQGDNVDG